MASTSRHRWSFGIMSSHPPKMRWLGDREELGATSSAATRSITALILFFKSMLSLLLESWLLHGCLVVMWSRRSRGRGSR